MFKIVLFFFFSILYVYSYGTGDSLNVSRRKKHGIGIEIGGSSLLYSLNYRYKITNNSNINLCASIGVGYLFDQITRFELLSTPIGIEADVKLKKNIYLVNKLACLFSFCKKPYPSDSETRKYYIEHKINDGTEIRRTAEPVFSYFLGVSFVLKKIDLCFGPALLVRQTPYDKSPLLGPWGCFSIYYKF